MARWVSDVFIEHKGIALIRSDAEQVTHLVVADPTDAGGKGPGDHVIELRLTLADRDEPLGIAVGQDDLRTAQGPFSGSGETAA